ncbi:pteridine reductase [Marinobacter nanhaiticus D15-8W]|uniref:Pteridine reductase n=1 Tax=Marinobacter nanhaiticus D15-8W TaxID=626887 RepID=N6WYQ6_9GAMM|nr:pteridine reductase [Marinobacter nanhaiticus]ENO16217.1 pteridine reductase [Marinobacter nanhaiticus D15-8W]BES72927.1 pteridine reductase [Marinobacter nanhaiticus D15-8W]
MTDLAPVALITGAAHRLGAATARRLHLRGFRVLIHYRSRQGQAQTLADELNQDRPESAAILQADLADADSIRKLGQQACDYWGRLDTLINNASVFYPTPTADASADDWAQIMDTNLRAPFLLGQACLDSLRARRGSIINLIDIYAERPLEGHPIYCASKAGLAMLTRSWAKDLGPDVRVNGVSPGAILWPEDENAMENSRRDRILAATSLKRVGSAEDIAGAIAYLVCDAPYITGHILPVDGGRSLNM